MVCHVGSAAHAKGESAVMKKLLIATAVTSLLTIVGPAVAADWPVRPLPPAVVIPVFTWSSCYLGGSFGYGWAHKDITDPIELVQDLLNGAGGLGLPPTSPLTTLRLTPKGYVLGGQFGCDHQFAGSNWVIGFEGAAIGGNLKNERFVGLPLDPDVTAGLIPGNPALVSARMDFIPSGTVRVGYAWDRVLLYVKGGAAGASDKYQILGIFTPISAATPFNFQGLDLRVGWTAGAGLEWAFCEDWSVKVEYDYYGFGHYSVLMSDSNLGVAGPVDIKQSVQTARVGVNFHMWSSKW
jgi:outer membrane immunogenic protein